MEKNKHQHYIPQLLLKRFAASGSGGGSIFCFDRSDAEGRYVSIKQAGSSEFFYRDGIDPDRPDRLDDFFNIVESRIGPILKLMYRSHVLPNRDSDEYILLIRFILQLHLRTPSVRAQLARAAPEVAEGIMKSTWKPEDWPLIQLQLKRMENGSVEQQYLAEMFQHVRTGVLLSEQSQRVLHAEAAGRDRKRVLRELRRRYWRLLIAPEDGPFFIVSDEPVVIHNHNNGVRTGLKYPNSKITLPLSSHVVLQGCFSPLRRDLEILKPFQVRKLNGVFARAAFREIFSSEEDFEWQHVAGRVFTSKEWMAGIPGATWPSNPTI